jgi:hypothetical protein
MPVRTVMATRYVTPLREGGSLPAIVEADDDGMYVLKFRGAGQGPKALIAEFVAGEIARALGLLVPEIVLVELDPVLARTEPDPEIQDLIRASAGLNLALDYLPGAVTFDPVADQPDADLASAVVWFERRTWRISSVGSNRRVCSSRRRCVRDLCTYDYAIIRLVPRVEREEFVNVGVIVSCPDHRFLQACIALDEQRLLALDATLDMATVRDHLATILAMCTGGVSAGPLGQLSQRERFHWLVAPRSTIIQTSPVHTGLCTNPATVLVHLMDTMVHPSCAVSPARASS